MYLEPCLAYKVEAGGHHAVVEGDNELLEGVSEGGRQSVDPGGEERVPAQHLWLHVHHATPRHLKRKRDTHMCRKEVKHFKLAYIHVYFKAVFLHEPAKLLRQLSRTNHSKARQAS